MAIILLCEILLIAITWYYIEIIQFNNECYQKIKQDYKLVSFYINVPQSCTWADLSWFYINRCTIFASYIVFMCILVYYHISSCYLFVHLYIYAGVLYNNIFATQETPFIYREAPILLYTLVLILYLEKQPFWDDKMSFRWTEITMKNEDQSFKTREAKIQLLNETIYRIKQTENPDDIKKIIEEQDKKEEKIQANYQLLNYPVLPSLESRKNILDIFIYISMFFICVLSVSSYMALFYRTFVA